MFGVWLWCLRWLIALVTRRCHSVRLIVMNIGLAEVTVVIPCSHSVWPSWLWCIAGAAAAVVHTLVLKLLCYEIRISWCLMLHIGLWIHCPIYTHTCGAEIKHLCLCSWFQAWSIIPGLTMSATVSNFEYLFYEQLFGSLQHHHQYLPEDRNF